MDKETEPCPPPIPEVSKTTNPRESITWPNGWIDAWGEHRKLNTRAIPRMPFRVLLSDDVGWADTNSMGPMPHRRVGA